MNWANGEDNKVIDEISLCRNAKTRNTQLNNRTIQNKLQLARAFYKSKNNLNHLEKIKGAEQRTSSTI